jgi:DNA-3-methyladenine glycosylase II
VEWTTKLWDEASIFLSGNKFISPLIQKWGKCTISPLQSKLYFEDLVDAICSQQLSGKAAKTIFGRVKASVNGKITPPNILKKTPPELRACGLSFAKITYLKDLAQKVQDGTLKLDDLSVLPDEEIIRELTTVKGIGRWTAEMFLMFSLARQDVFPLDDLGIQKGFEKVTGKKWDKKDAMEFAQKNWKPYRTAASWYLWRSLEQ